MVRVTVVCLTLFLDGCLSPAALDSLSLAYNEATQNDISKQLLLNIARAKNDDPIHFSGISNIAATLNFQANLGVSPALTGSSGSTLVPTFGVAAAENPTISIVPMQGEEFTKRMLAPISEDKLALLLRQNVDIDLLLRLVVLEYRAMDGKPEEVYHNRPRDRTDYALFRRIVLHLSSIQDQDELYFEPLTVVKHWQLPISQMNPKEFQELEKEFNITLDSRKGVYHLDKRKEGRMVITNYDLKLLSEQERSRLLEESENSAVNDVIVDVRKGYRGGEFPLHGRFRLRSFSNILYFIGRTLGTEPEYDIQKDPRTPFVSENPTFTLAIMESDALPAESDFNVKYQGKYYSIKEDRDYNWNKKAFRVLWQIFQMTMSELPRGNAIPSITISK